MPTSQIVLSSEPGWYTHFPLPHTLPQDGTKAPSASCDKTCQLWDLQSNQAVNIGAVSMFIEVEHMTDVCLCVSQHNAPIRCVRWIQAPTYQCAMTGSWDKTLKVTDSYIHVCVYIYLYIHVSPLPSPLSPPLSPLMHSSSSFPSLSFFSLLSSGTNAHHSLSSPFHSQSAATVCFCLLFLSHSSSSLSLSSSLLLPLSYRCTPWQWLVLLPEV